MKSAIVLLSVFCLLFCCFPTVGGAIRHTFVPAFPGKIAYFVLFASKVLRGRQDFGTNIAATPRKRRNNPTPISGLIFSLRNIAR